MYPFSYIFNVPSIAVVSLGCINVFIGTVSTLTTTTLQQLGNEDEVFFIFSFGQGPGSVAPPPGREV